MSTDSDNSGALSRRSFVTGAAVAATTVAVGAAKDAQAHPTPAATNVTIPPEFAAAHTAALPKLDFPLTGAQVFARACKEEGVAALFCCPGNYDVIHAIASTGIPSFGGRHEGSMAHAADAFIRSTGEIAACSGTEGPGFTNMICAIATAHAARTPLLVLASNMSIAQEDTEAGIQLSYQQPATEGFRSTASG